MTSTVKNYTGVVKVLVADDDASCRLLLRHQLEDIGDVIVRCVTNGAEAMEAFKFSLENECKFDVVFLDVRMPVMSGFIAADAIRSIDIEPYTPITMITGVEPCKDVLDRACIDGYLMKPVPPILLKTIINSKRHT